LRVFRRARNLLLHKLFYLGIGNEVGIVAQVLEVIGLFFWHVNSPQFKYDERSRISTQRERRQRSFQPGNFGRQTAGDGSTITNRPYLGNNLTTVGSDALPNCISTATVNRLRPSTNTHESARGVI